MQFTGRQTSLIEHESSLSIPLGRRLQVLESDGQRAIFFGATAIHIYDVQDRAAEAATLALLAHAGAATQVELAAAFGRHRNTVGRLERRLAHGGMAEVVPAKRGPRGPHKVNRAVLEVVREFASVGRVQVARAIAQRTGVQLHVRYVGRLLRQIRAETAVQGVLSPDSAAVPETETSGEARWPRPPGRCRQPRR